MDQDEEARRRKVSEKCHKITLYGNIGSMGKRCDPKVPSVLLGGRSDWFQFGRRQRRRSPFLVLNVLFRVPKEAVALTYELMKKDSTLDACWGRPVEEVAGHPAPCVVEEVSENALASTKLW
jgi:hypothetical protein